MAVWGDEVAKQLDQKFREQIDRMVDDVRTTIADIREVIDSQLDAAMQSVQADANSMSSKAMLAAVLADVAPPAAPEPPAPPVIARADASKVRDGIRAIEQGKSQVEVLNALLEQCASFGSRAALLILKGDSFAGWKGSGFTRTGGNDEAVKRFTAPAGTVQELDVVLRDERVVAWDGASVATKLGVSAPERAVVVPMVIKDKISAAMYVDAIEGEDNFDQAAVEMLVFTTGLLIDTLAVRKKVPSPSLGGGAAIAAPAAAPARVAAAPAPVSAPAPAPAMQVAPPPPAAPAPPPAPVAPPKPASSFALNQVPIVPPSPRPAAPPPPPNLQTTAIPAMREPAAPAPPPRPASGGDEESKPSTQFVPPPGLRGGAAALVGQQNEAVRKHDEARRFARLLVSEIKLYNEAKVEQGRKNKDLYERLKEDIDRSRQMYDERIPDDVRKASNYFYEELVRILADGDSGALGL